MFFEGTISLKEYYNKHSVGVSDFLYLLYLGFCTKKKKNELKRNSFGYFPFLYFWEFFPW